MDGGNVSGDMRSPEESLQMSMEGSSLDATQRRGLSSASITESSSLTRGKYAGVTLMSISYIRFINVNGRRLSGCHTEERAIRRCYKEIKLSDEGKYAGLMLMLSYIRVTIVTERQLALVMSDSEGGQRMLPLRH